MSYDNLTSGYSTSQTVETYELYGTIGAGGSMGDGGSEIQAYMCDSAFPYPDANYVPTAITRNQIKSGAGSTEQLEVKLPLNSQVAQWYLKQVPTYTVALKIRSFQLEDGDSVVAWMGTVRGSSITDDWITLMCEPITVSAKRAGVRRRMQYACPHVCYGDDCGIDALNFTFETNVSASEAGNWYTVTFDAANANAAIALNNWNTLLGGYATYTASIYGKYPTMLSNIIDVKKVGSTYKVRLDSPIPSLEADMVIKLTYGCTHALSYCRDVMGNVNNFGGTPWIPLENPLGANQFV